jgi:hypothetical protein
MTPDEPPFTFRTWAEQARADYELQTQFEAVSASASPIGHLFFGNRSTGEGSVGIYLELYYDKLSRSLSVCSFSFVAAENSFREEKVGAVNKFHFPDSAPLEVKFNSPTVLGKAYWFSIILRLQLEPDASMLLKEAKAQLHKNYSATDPYNNLKVPPASFPSRNQNLYVRGKLLTTGQFFCPNCFGRGSFNTMAISNADWASGATGYDLYSCNQTNGRVACHICGGTGGNYLPWYLKEHPELVGVSFTPGDGLLPSQET